MIKPFTTDGTPVPDPVTSSEVMGASEKRSDADFRRKCSALDTKVLPLALYRLKTAEMRHLLMLVTTLSIVSIPTDRMGI